VSKFVSFVVRRDGIELTDRRTTIGMAFKPGTKMRKGFLIAASLSLIAGTYASPALAAWGCGSQLYPGGHFRTSGFATKKEAGGAMLRLCGQQHRDCRILSCRENIETEAQANAVWPLTATNQVQCGGETGTKC
jgi:hypothetical protein